MRLTVLFSAVVSVDVDLEDPDRIRIALGVKGERARQLQRI